MNREERKEKEDFYAPEGVKINHISSLFTILSSLTLRSYVEFHELLDGFFDEFGLGFFVGFEVGSPVFFLGASDEETEKEGA